MLVSVPQWRSKLHERRRSMRLTPEQGRKIATRWERDAVDGLAPGQPELAQLWVGFSTSTDYVREAAGVGSSKAGSSSTVPDGWMALDGGLTA
jgi:hypothetical protein